MEEIDFVIQCTLTYDFYSWENDWYPVNVNNAKGFSTEDRAWEVIQMHNLKNVTVKKRITHTTSETI